MMEPIDGKHPPPRGAFPALRRRRLLVAVGAADTRADDARLWPQCDVLEPLGSAARRHPADLSAGPAWLRRLRRSYRGLLLHAREDRSRDFRGARVIVAFTGALGRGILGRDHRPATRRGTSR